MERWGIVKAFTLGALLEATIPKPGNVNRLRDFEDLTLYHFLSGNTATIPVYYEATKVGELIKKGISAPSEAGIGDLIRRGVESSKRVQDANPNFGVITLSIPLVIGLSMAKDLMDGREKGELLIRESTIRDTMELYRAIRKASPKGIQKTSKYDVYSENSFKELFEDRINLWKLAEISCERELIFCEWISKYSLSYSTADRLLDLMQELPLEDAVRTAFIELLASRRDTLILRKAGKEEAELVRKTAKRVLSGALSPDEFDEFLREKGDLRNPGSLADIMAVSLSLLALLGLRIEVRSGEAVGVIKRS